MASKRFKNKVCAYCGQPGISETGDHVVARAFFLEERRGNLPKVPACAACNQAKSTLEHYLATVLPFGGRHADAVTHLREKVPPRLEENIPLARELHSGRRAVWRALDDGNWTLDHGEMPIDPSVQLDLCRYIAKGLAYHHWDLLLPETATTTYPTYLTQAGARLIEPFFMKEGEHAPTRGDLGNGTFRYEGVKGAESTLSMWRMSIFGAESYGDPRAPDEIVDRVHVFTGPTSMRSFMDFIVALGAVLPEDIPAGRPTDPPEPSEIPARPSTLQDEA